MGRVIDTDSAYAVLTDYYHHTTDTQHTALREALGRVETVDAVPVVHGRWIHHKGGYSDHYECTACGKPIVLTAKWDFCPNCGADMRGEHEKAD